MSAAKFDDAVKIVGSMPKDGPVQPTQDDQLKFYGLYKQATIGDVNTSRPGMMDFTGKYKWDAWKKNEGLSQDDAKSQYVAALIAILEKHSDQEDAKQWLSQLK
ncbi:acyl-CoA-binding protein [Meira miltonrushii]|uniref:Acyl-CoA-binding protein n=1 Tax=Meira miltonrushii TaxID=1280837 RepID=A0A316V6B9_9BASI|nr:acyl-CoA-binding protein [Meira miltonrushii]PWN33046.1 acyl-CoA-binding protein [Meira miltonrushii]